MSKIEELRQDVVRHLGRIILVWLVGVVVKPDMVTKILQPLFTVASL
jgi:hypothetical protein